MVIKNKHASLWRTVVMLLVLCGTVAGGLLQRRLSGGGGAAIESMSTAASSLEKPLPNRVGNWRQLPSPPMQEDVLKMLRCPAHISRAYVHDLTGDRVSVAVLLGPPGPIAVHTPEICFSSQDFTITSERVVARVAKDEFWDVKFRFNGPTPSDVRVLYGWSKGTGWQASKDPRFEYSHLPYLYKIQLSGPVASDDSTDFDPCADFLTHFLSQLQPQLLAADSA